MHEAKSQPSRLVERAAAGEDVVIARAARPVARLVPYVERTEPRTPGRWKGKIVTRDRRFDATTWPCCAAEGRPVPSGT